METEARLRSAGTTTFVLCYLTALVEGFDLLAAGVTAPPEGLALVEVLYPQHFALPRYEDGP